MSHDENLPVYTAAAPPVPSSEELRARIPGWGVDLDPADRPAHPKMNREETGAHWVFPERQAEEYPRERSIEHEILPPVFGTTAPLHGLSGAIRRYSYARFSEGRAAHWLLLIAADRVDAVESHLTSLVSGRPDNPVTETGVKTELTHDGLGARRESTRADVKHQWLDPILVGGPWVLAGAAAFSVVRRLTRGRRER